MRLLDRYLLRELLIPLGYCLSGFLVFWISADLISDLEDFQRHALHPLDVIQYYAFRLPEFLGLLLPIALLLALLYALTTHARHHEIIAIRAAGLSLWRLCAPYFALALALCVVLLAVSQWVLPPCSERARQILEGWTQGDAPGKNPRRWISNLNFINSRDNRRWTAREYDLLEQVMRGVDVEWRLPEGRTRRWIARQAVWTDGRWELRDVQEYDFRADEGVGLPVAKKRVVLRDFAETPAYILSQIKLAELESIRIRQAIKVQFSIQDILEYRRLHPRMEERKRNLMTTKLHAQLAEPCTCLVVVLIAIPFGARGGRRDAFVGIASSIFLCFAFFVIQHLSLPLGMGGHIPGALAAWIPNLVFGSIGLAMTWRAN